MEPANWIALGGLVIALGGLSVAVPQLVLAVRQYRHAQQWRRAEFAAKEYKEFSSNPEVQNVMLILDWPNRPIKELPGQDKIVSNDLLESALKAEGLHPPYPETHIALRDWFDEFFDGLEQFEYYIKSGLLSKEELEPYLPYWLNLLVNPPRRSNAAKDALLAYAERYNPDVKDLLKRYECCERRSENHSWRRLDGPTAGAA